MNNPLRYTDESGEFFFSALILGLCTIDAMSLGAVIGAGISAVTNLVTNNWSWSSIAVRAVGGAIGGGISGIGGTFTNSLELVLQELIGVEQHGLI